LIISTAATFSHVYVCTQHINKDQYRFYALNYLDFTVLSSAKMTINDGKLSRISDRQPQLGWWLCWPPDLNFGRQKRSLVAQVTILVGKN
jgi:hypothetical protein